MSRARSAARSETEPRPATRPPTGERDRTPELHGRRGWAWLRPLRRLDDYERALAELEPAAVEGPKESPLSAAR